MATHRQPRTERRRAQVKTRIVAEAARQFAEHGFDAVRIDELAEAADVARGTLYSHFPSKEAIVHEILVSALVDATRRIEALDARSAAVALEGLLDVYLWMWREHRDGLRVAYRFQESPLLQFGLTQQHHQFVVAVLEVLEKAAREKLLRAPSAMLAALSLSKVAVPLLTLYSDSDPDGALFKSSVRGLLLADDRAPSSAGLEAP